MINVTAQYHLDGLACADPWSCANDQHTTVPPKCGARVDCGEPACVLTAGHPGPHLPAA
jgi:hypothetical protein